MKEREFYQEKYKLLKENEMFSEKDKLYIETHSESKIETPNYNILIKRREKEPFTSNNDQLIKVHQKLLNKFSMHHYDPIVAGNIDSSRYSIHDNGINRAIHSNYDPYKDKNISPNANNTIFISKLSEHTKKIDLEDFFSKYGPIYNITIPKNLISGMNKGYAFIEFKYIEDALKAYENSHKFYLLGRKILVDFMRGKNQEGWVPRRLGGGLGGDIKSGQLRYGGRDLHHREKRDRYSSRDHHERDYYDKDYRSHKRYHDFKKNSNHSIK